MNGSMSAEARSEESREEGITGFLSVVLDGKSTTLRIFPPPVVFFTLLCSGFLFSATA